jgi:proteasome activator subunit 4
MHQFSLGTPLGPLSLSIRLSYLARSVFVDKMPTGFIAWTPTIEVYTQVSEGNRPEWEAASLPTLEAIESVITSDGYCHRMLQLWSQESSRAGSTAELRSDHSTFIKSLALLLGLSPWSAALSTIEPMMADPDKYKQRASAELLAGLLRGNYDYHRIFRKMLMSSTQGSKHWPPSEHKKIWDWGLERLAGTFNIMKPDTLPCWEGFFSVVLDDLDPRRNQRLVDWMLSLPLDFHGNSAFDSKRSCCPSCTLTDVDFSEQNTHVVRYRG